MTPAPRLVLAPMEGLADDILRDVLTRAGPYDWCVTEFIRVSTTVLPPSVFTRVSPELRRGARTRAGTPVRVQLLGSDPGLLAANAAQAAALRPAGIDLNFGCPAPLINRHGGGSALLADPERMARIAAAVRAAVPAAMPVTAKMRLGIEDSSRAVECACALQAGGIDELVVHARTRADGYRPPARWPVVAAIREALAIPVIANGEVWTLADYQAIRAETGCQDVMLGRGAVADPLLTRQIRHNEPFDADRQWPELAALIGDFWGQAQNKVLPAQAPGRLKQWLLLLSRRYGQAGELFAALRPLKSAAEVTQVLGALPVPANVA
jgi:tRNA-dihydrouridine synthase C